MQIYDPKQKRDPIGNRLLNEANERGLAAGAFSPLPVSCSRSSELQGLKANSFLLTDGSDTHGIAAPLWDEVIPYFTSSAPKSASMVAPRRRRLKKIALSVCLFISCALLVARTALRRPLEDLPPLPTVEPFPDSAFVSLRLPGFDHGTADPCRSNSPSLLTIVHSAPTHLPHRKAIRQTWGRPSGDSRTVFVVGRSFHPQIRQRVRIEAEQNGDMVLLDMPDSYRNLTLKHLAGLRWLLSNCPDARHVLKADDDVFVDVRRAMKILASAVTDDDLIACRVVPDGTAPKRSGKWKVTKNEYPPRDYPEYCSGLAYFSRPAALRKVLLAALSGKVPHLWIDDVFVTGLAAQRARVRRLDLGVWYARDDWDAIRRLREGRPMPWIVVEMQPRHWPADALDIWRMANGKST